MVQKVFPLLQRLHTELNKALWAGLTAALIFFGAVTLPHIKENQAAYRLAEETEISAGNDLYCRRWNFVPGTQAYRACLDDLTTLRASIARTAAEQANF